MAVGQCHLENGTAPQEPALSEAEKADMQRFVSEVFQILPLLNLNAFEFPKAVAEPMTKAVELPSSQTVSPEFDTIIVPAQKDGFEKVFLGMNCWWAVRISGGMLPKIKYIAAYQSQPISAITHVAPVSKIEPHGDSGKYKLIFSEAAKPIGPVPFADAPSGFMQGPRYTSYIRLASAKKISDLVS
jgi:hypothetical protein